MPANSVWISVSHEESDGLLSSHLYFTLTLKHVNRALVLHTIPQQLFIQINVIFAFYFSTALHCSTTAKLIISVIFVLAHSQINESYELIM